MGQTLVQMLGILQGTKQRSLPLGSSESKEESAKANRHILSDDAKINKAGAGEGQGAQEGPSEAEPYSETWKM